LLKEKDNEIKDLRVKIQSGDNQYNEQGSLLKATVENEISLKIDLHESNL
jgi:hypothetical protein